MIGLDKYKKGQIEVEKPFTGLPYVLALLAKSLITLADSSTGIVSNISYHDIAKTLTVYAAPGRKDSGTPTKQTIRNHIKSIERECGEYFKVISEGQTLKFLFPELPQIFSKVFENRGVNTQVNPANIYENIDENDVFEDKPNTHLNTEVNTPNHAVKKLFININNKTNNNNTLEAITNKISKQPISADFYPNEKTIARAIASGYSFAADAEVIQEFIDKNTAWGSEFADFNPIYLSFLSKHAQHQQQKAVTQNSNTRSRKNEHSPHKNSSHESLMARARENNPHASKAELFPTPRAINYEEGETYSQSHLLALA